MSSPAPKYAAAAAAAAALCIFAVVTLISSGRMVAPHRTALAGFEYVPLATSSVIPMQALVVTPEWKPRHQIDYMEFQEMCVDACGGPNVPGAKDKCDYDNLTPRWLDYIAQCDQKARCNIIKMYCRGWFKTQW